MHYQLRRYRSLPGKLPALHARFRDHTLALMERHGIAVVGMFDDDEGNLVYLCQFPSRAAAAQAWQAFSQDPDWQAVKAATEAEGPLQSGIDSWDLTPVDFVEPPRKP